MAPNPQPLRRYLSAQRRADVELEAILRDAAEEAERLMVKLGERYNIGAEIRRAQVALVLRELRAQQALMWDSVDDALHNSLTYAADAAADAEEVLTDYLFGLVDTPSQPALTAAYRAQAQATVRAYAGRTARKVSLSRQVYKTRALANGWVDREINRGILLGKGPREIAASVRTMINPRTPGGVSYAAMRLGRTEVNNAFHEAQKALRKGDPFVAGMEWNLSGSHPRADDCDRLARDTHFQGGGPGVFKPEDVPGKPHPQCFCFLTAVPIDDDEFIEGFLSGQYDSFIRSKIERYPATIAGRRV